MLYTVLLLWFVIPTLFGRDVVPTSVRHNLFKRYSSYSYSYDYVYCNPGTYYTIYACPCNSISTIICCCPYQPSPPYPTSPPVPPPPVTARPVPLNGKMHGDVISPLIVFAIILCAMLL
ncbi:hypothetical protein OESDEN_15799 [Oesophagostomum dentatum]|uniref:Uncharacterized protein n=1 Tax=Oesophagostomum dentatum TaxID=61180 RepID=A0A0B1SKS1_OESDE|nr:hypothetical protein OESDEN_15799 [Oesophagostomum dentatum]